MEGAVPPISIDSDQAQQGRKLGRRMADSRFMWVSSSPSLAEVAAMELSCSEVIQVPPVALEHEARCWERHAVLARSIQCWIPSEIIIREFQKAGVAGEIGAVCLAHRCYIFQFSESNAKELVLGRPWVINGQPIATAEWEEQFIPAPDSLPSALIWVGYPICLLNSGTMTSSELFLPRLADSSPPMALPRRNLGEDLQRPA